MTRCFLPSLVLFAVVQSADANTWGSCDIWNREKRGCSIPSGHLCSSYLSNGPPGATFEIVLSGLPASTAGSPVHVSWWAPHEAVGYDPRQKSQTITVYKNMSAAYPKFSSNNFNGGNVRVNETGHATLRFKAPSTYYMWRPFWIPYPHINLRLCFGQSFMMYRSERIEFKLGIVRVQACGSQGSYRVDKFTKLAPIQTSSSTLATSTTSSVVLSTTSPGSLIQTPDTNADDSFDWGALEFSPVYLCIQSNMLYNYFLETAANYCVGTCPQYAAAQYGQCVRKSTNVLVDFNVSWSLLVQCDQACWNAKISRTRHSLRLAAADHLDITFQEVEKMVLRPGSFSSRRLQTIPGTSATLFASVKTDRFYDVQVGRNLLKSFLPSVQVASAILGLTVQSMQVDTGVGLPNGNLLNGEDSDEFIPIYKQALGGSGNTGGQFGNTSTEGLPTGVIVAGIVGFVLLGPIGVILFWYKRRQRRNFAKDMAAVGQDDNENTMPSATENVGDNEADTIREPARAMGGGDVCTLVKGPKEAYLTLAEKGSLTCRETSVKVFGQSFIAGCYIGFGALLAVAISGNMAGATERNPGLKSLIFAFLFPVNLVLIILTGGILFTGSSATAPAALYEGKAKMLDVVRVLVLSWWGNVLGSAVFAVFTVWCDLHEGPTRTYAASIAYKKTSLRFDQTFARGIGCNWMVCMAVFLSGQAQDFTGKCVAIYLPISTFVMIGFEHIPANFYLLCLAMVNGDVEFVDVLLKNWIPVTLGNFVAGAFIVALVYSFFFGRLGTKFVADSEIFQNDARKSTGITVDSMPPAVSCDNAKIGEGDAVAM